MVPHKGGGDAYSIRLAVAFLDGLGIQEGILRTDGEPSILDWAKQVKKAWKGKLVLEASARGSAESKGGVERSIQTIQGMVRTLKLDLEERLGTTLETTTPVLAWLVRHAGWLLTRYQRHGRLGATSFQVLRGVPYEGQLVRFGEVVVYRYPFGLAGDGHGRHKLDPRWGVGVWLGRTESSNEHVVGTERGVERVRVVRRRPVGQQDDADQVKKMRGFPWELLAMRRAPGASDLQPQTQKRRRRPRDQKAKKRSKVKFGPVEVTEIPAQEPQEAGGAEMSFPPGLETNADVTNQDEPIQVDDNQVLHRHPRQLNPMTGWMT